MVLLGGGRNKDGMREIRNKQEFGGEISWKTYVQEIKQNVGGLN
jgi:hypothetical protein